MKQSEFVNIGDPPLFVIDEIVFKAVFVAQHTESDFTEEVYRVLARALLEYLSKRNMSLGYSTITMSKRKEV